MNQRWLQPWPLVLAAALGPLGAGCVLTSPHVESSGAIPCSTNQECPGGMVCFLGECRGNSSLLGTVYAEVRPPSSTPYAPVQRAGIDLRQSIGIIDFLVGGAKVSGHVLQAQDPDGGVVLPPAPLSGAQVTFVANDTVIPGRTPRVQAQTASAGDFSVLLPATGGGAGWEIEVQAPPLPPRRLSQQTFPDGGPDLDVVLPPSSQLVRQAGVATQGGVPLSGASVIAVGADGGILSTGTTADVNGAFAVTLPPNPFPYFLRVSGPGAADGGAPLPAFDPAGPFNGPPDAGFDKLPPQAVYRGRVVDSSQAPVASARVYALSLSGVGWVLTTSAVTAADGTFSLNLLAGRYALEVAPATGPTEPALGVPDRDPDVPAGISSLQFPIVCPPRVSAQGIVLRPDGRPVGAGTQISATRLPDRLVSSRSAQVSPTDSNGRYTIVGDPGQYRVEFLPPLTPPTTLPRKLVTLTLQPQPAQQTLPAVHLAVPLEVVGIVRANATGVPVGLATVDFFALDSASHAVVIGSGVTDSRSGAYRIVLPDVRNPASGSP
ncbi:MAG: hypothetical protein NVSMB23_13760 [Myxococcales bacterium]